MWHWGNTGFEEIIHKKGFPSYWAGCILTCVPGLSFLTTAFHTWPVAGTSQALWDRGRGWQRQRRRSLQQHSVDHCKKETAEGIWAVEPLHQQSASWACTLNSIRKNWQSWGKESQGQRAVTWTRGRKNLVHPIFLYNWKTPFWHQRYIAASILFANTSVIAAE